MEELDLISEIESRQKELVQAFVGGLPDWDTYLRIVGQYKGLEESKILIHEVYVRQNNGENDDTKDEF